MADISGTRCPELTIESTKLARFNPPNLEADDGNNTRIDVENPFVANPIERDHSIKEIDRPSHGEGKYYLPSDQAELSRLDRQHVLWTRALDGDFLKAPVKDPKHVLDVGTGTGIWAVEYAKLHPDAEVLGIDLSKPTPPEVPPNCKFEEKDFTDPWNYPQKFDLIHCRLIFTAPHDPRKLLRQAYDSLAPGGYLEHQEMYGFPLDVDGSLGGTFLEQFFFDGVVAVTRLGNDNMLALPRYKQWMAEVGFEDVVEEHRALPINSWPKGKYKAVGDTMLGNLEAGMGGLYTRILTKGLGWSPEKTAEAVEKALKQAHDTSIHAYFPIFVVYGRKSLSAI
ncbi:S-adenosyl-L-methionine-dependent methyltransferase [Hypoxylon sp. FL1857]|nr:S-adenosyl-L-methionine-dependent methyltransferase [Hypoxylon sp. FL1857]